MGLSIPYFQVIDLKTQLGNFKKVEKQLRHKLGHAEAYTLLSEAVYLIAIGSNDYSYALATNSSLLASSPEEFIGLVIGNMTNVIKVLLYAVIYHDPILQNLIIHLLHGSYTN